MASQFERVAAALMAQKALAHESADADKKRLDKLKDSERLWVSMSKSSTLVARNLLSIGGSLLKWGSLLAGGIIGGSLFGIDKMAAGVGDQRRSSMGLGMSIGQQRSFELNFSRLVNPGAFLQGVSNAQQIGQQGPLYSLGVNPNGSTSDVALATMRAVRKLVMATPENQLGVLGSSRHMDQFNLSTEDLRRYKHMSNSEFEGLMSRFPGDASRLDMSDGKARGWSDLKTQFERSLDQIQNSTAKALGTPKMTAAMGKLSDSAAKAWERFLTGPAVERGIDKLSDWLTKFSGEVDASDFMTKVNAFVSGIGELGDAIQKILHPIDTAAAAVGGKLAGWFGSSASKASNSPGDFENYLGDVDRKYGLPKQFLETISQLEARGALYPRNSSKGAIGAMQIMPATAAGYGVNVHDLYNPAVSGDLSGQIGRDNMHGFRGDVLKALAAYNMGSSALQKDVAKHGNAWLQYAPAETQDYVKRGAAAMHINIQNQTGGNAVVITNSMAQ